MQQESESSPDSSDIENNGIGVLIDRINNYLDGIDIGNISFMRETDVEEVDVQEIKQNPEKYYFVFFRGISLNYLKDHKKRREYYKKSVADTLNNNVIEIQSVGYSNYSKQKTEGIFGCLFEDQFASDFAMDLNLSEKVSDSSVIKSYKSPSAFEKTISEIGSPYGNPLVSVTRNAETAFKYADIGGDGSLLAPSYKEAKARHRVMGEIDVIVVEANEYYSLKVTDIEELRRKGEIGGKCAVERDNQEIIFPGRIPAKYHAGSVPIAYPSYHKSYKPKYKNRYGVTEEQYKSNKPKSKAPSVSSALRKTILPQHFVNMAWKCAIKHIKTKNLAGEPVSHNIYGKIIKLIKYKYAHEENRGFTPAYNSASINIHDHNFSSEQFTIKAYESFLHYYDQIPTNRNQCLSERLSQEADKYGYEVCNVTGDGNCFFHAIVHQLLRLDQTLPYSHEDLRRLTIKELCEHPDNYSCFGNINDMILDNINGGSWENMSQVIPMALSRAINKSIIVLRSDGVRPTIFKRPRNLDGTEEPILYIGNEVGWHFQSLLPLSVALEKQQNLKEIFNIEAEDMVNYQKLDEGSNLKRGSHQTLR